MIDINIDKPKNNETVIINVRTFYGVKYTYVAIFNDGQFEEVTTNQPFLNIDQKEITHWQSLPDAI